MEYRAIRDGEWDEAMELWTKVFGPVGWIFQSLHDSTTDRSPEHTRVAVVDGRIVSAVDVFMRDLRGIDGQPLKVGGIGSVATYEEHRKQGHSGHLLTDAIEMMNRENCAWSFLFTGTHHHYERYGWITLPLSARCGQLRQDLQPAQSDYAVSLLSGAWPLQDMAKVYDDFNATRPLSTVRTSSMWDIAVRVRLERPDRQTWAAWQGSNLVAYLSATFDEEQVSLDEACCATGHADAFTPLFAAVHAEAKARDLTNADFLFSMTPALFPYIEAIADSLDLRMRPHTMARPLAGGLDEAELRALFSAPERMHYELDNF